MRAFITALALILLPAAALAAEVSTGYKVDRPLAPGTVVRFDPQDKEKVLPATVSDLETLFGVVTADSETLVEIKDSGDTVQVVTSGVARVLVTAHDGSIREGNFVAPVSLSGIASLAGRQKFVLGVAKESFDGTGPKVIGTIGELAPGFQSDTVPADTKLGLIEVEINVVGNPNLQLGAIQAVARYFADRGVAPLKFILSFIIFFAALDIVGTVLYGTTKGSLISMGRNPLSAKSIYVGLAEVSTLSLALLGLSLGAMYLLLK